MVTVPGMDEDEFGMSADDWMRAYGFLPRQETYPAYPAPPAVRQARQKRLDEAEHAARSWQAMGQALKEWRLRCWLRYGLLNDDVVALEERHAHVMAGH